MSIVFQVRRGSCTMRAPRSWRRNALGQQSDQVVALDELAALVEEEAAVVVAVPGQADVGARAPHRLRGRGAVLLEHRIGHAVRKGAVGRRG